MVMPPSDQIMLSVAQPKAPAKLSTILQDEGMSECTTTPQRLRVTLRRPSQTKVRTGRKTLLFADSNATMKTCSTTYASVDRLIH